MEKTAEQKSLERAIEDGGGPAFPQGLMDAEDNYKLLTVAAHCGISIRDYFAAKAMQSLAGPIHTAAHHDYRKELQADINAASPLTDVCETVAGIAYAQADAMLAARKAGA